MLSHRTLKYLIGAALLLGGCTEPTPPDRESLQFTDEPAVVRTMPGDTETDRSATQFSNAPVAR